MNFSFNFLFLKEIIFGIILILVVALVISLFFSVWRNHSQIKFYKCITREDGTIAKSGIAFIITLVIVCYQALFVGEIIPGLQEIFMIIIASELGEKFVDGHNKYKLTNVKKTINDPKSQLSDDEFKDL